MGTATNWIDAPWSEIYEAMGNIHNWPLWNGAIQEVRETERSNEFVVRVNILGWIYCRVKDQLPQEKQFAYELFGKGNRETGTLRLVEESFGACLIEYQVKHEGWLKLLTPLESVTSWRVGRLKELCENGSVVDPYGRGMSQ